MDEPSIRSIIERLQLCIVDAKTLQLDMLERLLSMALMQAHQDRDESRNGRG